MVREQDDGDAIDWDWLLSQERESASGGVCHVHLADPFTLKVDGENNEAVGVV